MTDRELLELAARAAGIVVNEAAQAERDENGYGHRGLWINLVSTAWNPLEDDGHAMRLAVKLRIAVYFRTNDNGAFVIANPPGALFEVCKLEADPYAATRRAITRAAAALGAKA